MSSLSDVFTDENAPASSPRPQVGTPCSIGIDNNAEYSQSLAHVDIGHGVIIARRREPLTSCLSDHTFDVTPPLPSPPDSAASCASSDDLEGTPTLTTPPGSPSYVATKNAFQPEPTTLTPPESPSSSIATGRWDRTPLPATRAGSSRCWTIGADLGQLGGAATLPGSARDRTCATDTQDAFLTSDTAPSQNRCPSPETKPGRDYSDNVKDASGNATDRTHHEVNVPTVKPQNQAEQAKVRDRRACVMATLARSVETRQRVLKLLTEDAMVGEARKARNADFRRDTAILRTSMEELQTSDLGQLGAAAALPDCARDRTCATDTQDAFLTSDTALIQNTCPSPETQPRRGYSENVKEASGNASDRTHHAVNVPTVKPPSQAQHAKVRDLRASVMATLARSVETRQRVSKLTTEDPMVTEARKTRNENFRRDIAILRKSTEELQTSTQEIRADMTMLQGQRAELEMAMKSYRLTLHQEEADMAEIMAERVIFRRQLDKLQSQNMKFRNDNARCEIEIQKIKEETRAINTAQEGFRVRIDELHDSNNVLLAESMTVRGRVDQARIEMDTEKEEMATMRKRIGRVREEQCRMRNRIDDITEGYQQIIPFACDHYAMSNDQATPQTRGRDSPQFTLKRKRPGVEQEDAYNYWLSTNKRQRSSAVDGGRVR